MTPAAESPPYVGRFAPSPTGPLHFGSAVAAVAGYVQARAAGGRWLLRIDDLDPPREVAGAGVSILRSLDTLGLHWDGPVLYQSQRREAYDQALEKLWRGARVYPCGCTRAEVGKRPYRGTCRAGLAPGRTPRALRVLTSGDPVEFHDRLQGPMCRCLETEVGDFIVKRADGLVAYHLATVVDDAWAGITEVFRGVDLLDSTPRQIHLQRLLGLPEKRYGHFPVVLDRRGKKLSKQTGAAAIDDRQAGTVLVRALTFLGHRPPDDLAGAAVATLLGWAVTHWRVERVPRCSRAADAAP